VLRQRVPPRRPAYLAATDGYLIVNPNDAAGNFDNGEDYVVVLQNHNTLASFVAGDIISI